MSRKRDINIERGCLLGEFQTDTGQALIRADDVSAVVALNRANTCDIHMMSGTIFTVEMSLTNVLQMLQLEVCCVAENDDEEEYTE